MSDYHKFIIPTPCSEICPALIESEAFSHAYRRVANKAVDFILHKWGDQQAGRLVHLDGNEVAALVDELLSVENTDGSGA